MPKNKDTQNTSFSSALINNALSVKPNIVKYNKKKTSPLSKEAQKVLVKDYVNDIKQIIDTALQHPELADPKKRDEFIHSLITDLNPYLEEPGSFHTSSDSMELDQERQEKEEDQELEDSLLLDTDSLEINESHTLESEIAKLSFTPS